MLMNSHGILTEGAQDMPSIPHGPLVPVEFLELFNKTRNRRDIRQLLRAVKADSKGRLRLLGIDVSARSFFQFSSDAHTDLLPANRF